MVRCEEEGAAGVSRRSGDALGEALGDAAPAAAPAAAPDDAYGFRLCGEGDRDSAASASVYSFCKQRIDAMFDETRSQLSCGGGRASLCADDDEEERRQRRINNSVQARIERMFAEMAAGERSRDAPLAAPVRFAVQSLGAATLRERVTSLQGLQRPLADLYFAHLRRRDGGAPPALGAIEISGQGLKVVQENDVEPSPQEQLNPFPSIAVWAAVSFVSREGPTGAEFAFLPLVADRAALDKGALFHPLAERQPATSALADGAHAPLLAVVMRRGAARALHCHAFVCARAEDAVVAAATLYRALVAFMAARPRPGRRPHAPRNCNGVSYVSVASGSVAGDAPELPLRLSNGSVAAATAAAAKCDFPGARDTLPLPKRQPPPPVRPPRRKGRSSASSASEDGEEPIVIQQGLPSLPLPLPLPQPLPLPPPDADRSAVRESFRNGARGFPREPSRDSLRDIARDIARDFPPEEPPDLLRASFRSPSRAAAGDAAARARHSRSESEPCAGAASVQLAPMGVRRTASDLHGYAASSAVVLPLGDGERGDILTKVAIPRSRSFLNAGGPLTRYGRRAGPSAGGGGAGSPLGFRELFAEFRAQEGLSSVDDILGAIVSAEGMSFNDLRPLYKEFLLKLAVTLTKDELYARSKSIMRRQRKKKRRAGAGCVARKKSSAGGGLKRVFRRSVGKLKPSKPRPQSFEFTSVLFPSAAPLRASKKIRGGFSVESSTTSTSSYSARHFQPPTGGDVHTSRRPSSAGSQTSQTKRRAAARPRAAPARRPHASASEDSDFFSLARASGGSRQHQRGASLAHNRSSSGYFSCSECSYDSESCTCASADKCYCSLGEGKARDRARAEAARRDRTLSSCGCDTDSCRDSDKCYCAAHSRARPPPGTAAAAAVAGSVFDQLKQRGFAASESSASRAPSPARRPRAPAAPASVRAARSLELLGAQRQPMQRRSRSDEAPGAVTRRMDVYTASDATSPQPRAASRRSLGSDNLVVDYDLFTTSSRSDEERVLVVSARDPRGRVVCVGASCRSSVNRVGGGRSRPPLPAAGRRAAAAAKEALSVKKSAEIAAVFSDMRPGDEVRRDALGKEQPDYYFASRGSTRSYLGSSLENSLGYLP